MTTPGASDKTTSNSVKDSKTFNQRVDADTYNNITDTQSFTNRKDTTTYNNLKDETSFNQREDTTTYNNVKDETSFNQREDTKSYNNVKDSRTFTNRKDKTTYSSGNTNTRNLSDTEHIEHRRFGNIGVTKSTDLIDSQRETVLFDFFKKLVHDCVNLCTYAVE